MHGSGFKLGSLVKILPIDMTGHIIQIRRDKYNQPLYDIEREDGEYHVARGYELSACLEDTRTQAKQ